MFNTSAKLTEASATRLRAFLVTHGADPLLRSIELLQLQGQGRTERVAATDEAQNDVFAWVEMEARSASVHSPSGFFELLIRKRKRGKPPRCRIELRSVATGDAVLSAVLADKAADRTALAEADVRNRLWAELALSRERVYIEHETKRLGLLATAQDRASNAAPDKTTGAYDTANRLIDLLTVTAQKYGDGRPKLGGLNTPALAGAVPAKALPSSTVTTSAVPPDDEQLSAEQCELAVQLRLSITPEQRAAMTDLFGDALVAAFVDATEPRQTGLALLTILQIPEQHKLIACIALLSPEQQAAAFGLPKA